MSENRKSGPNIWLNVPTPLKQTKGLNESKSNKGFESTSPLKKQKIT